MNARRSQRLFDPLFTTERMCEIFSDHGRVQSMLDFEAALARAEAHAGVLSFADKLGKTQAHALVEEASARAVRERRHLRDVLLAYARVGEHLAPADIERLLDARRYTGQAERLVARALAARKPEGDGSADA